MYKRTKSDQKVYNTKNFLKFYPDAFRSDRKQNVWKKKAYFEKKN